MIDSAPSETKTVDVRRHRRFALALAAGLLALSLLALLVGSLRGSPSASEPGAADSAAVEWGAGSDATAVDARFAGSRTSDEEAVTDAGGSTVAGVSLDDRAVIRSGSLSLSAADVANVRSQVLDALITFGGFVADEQSRADENGDLRLTELTVQVPTREFDAAMERFSTAGTVAGRTQSARDVTEQVVDVSTRVESAEASLRRIRLLLGRAVSLGDVIRLEQVLSSRQADLESLLAQQESLAAKTDLATVRVTIEVPAADPPVDEVEPAGFFAGLSRGWDALAAGYVTLATALGTALPTLLVLGASALLVRLVIRRFRRRSAPAAAAV